MVSLLLKIDALITRKNDTKKHFHNGSLTHATALKVATLNFGYCCIYSCNLYSTELIQIEWVIEVILQNVIYTFVNANDEIFWIILYSNGIRLKVWNVFVIFMRIVLRPTCHQQCWHKTVYWKIQLQQQEDLISYFDTKVTNSNKRY